MDCNAQRTGQAPRSQGACPAGYNSGVADSTAPSAPVLSFEVCLDELEKVVKELEAGDLPLERSLELFEKGMSLSETCRKQLEEAETRVEMLIRKEGKIQPEPFRAEKA
jgi:exodeoxyribonuclease VII small subunit